jgi:multidrug resistance efflux pump
MNPTPPRFAALDLVPTPRLARRLGRGLLALGVALPLALLAVPWQQSAVGHGRLTALDPTARVQALEATIDGRVKKWFKMEGDPVRAGEVIVELEDNDPQLAERLEIERSAVLGRKAAAEARVEQFKLQEQNLKLSKAFAENTADQNLRRAREVVQAAERARDAEFANHEAAHLNLGRQRELRERGLNSVRDLELAVRDDETTKNALLRSRSNVEIAEKELGAAEETRKRVTSDYDAQLDSLRALQQAAVAEVKAAEREVVQVTIRIERQKAQRVTAPCAGTLLRVTANTGQGGQYVRAGEQLAVIVPDVTPPPAQVPPSLHDPASIRPERVAEIWIDGNDAPLVPILMAERKAQGKTVQVRLQFEGWPAVQLVGWPSLARGTFGGQVWLMDAADDGKGKFRLLVAPDPAEEATNPWPPPEFLRQGVRANAWVLLNQVPVGWELWRQINGFPAVVPLTKPDKALKIKGMK